MIVLIDQLAALARAEQLVDAEDWRSDKRKRWTTMLRRLVHSMDWSTGLVCGVTLAQLAEAGRCAPRTVSRLLAWAQDVDLLVVVEAGATATFLGADRNRAPAYAFVTPAAKSTPDEDADSATAMPKSAQVSGSVDKSGDLPHGSLGIKPSVRGRRRISTSQSPPTWPMWQIPATPSERNAAVLTLLRRTGLGTGRVPIWRVRGLLARWWADDVCLAGLLWMIDHHPDRPDQARGDALRGALDPVRVLGHRLSPWIGQLHRLPVELAGRRGDYRQEQAARVAERVATAKRTQQHHLARPQFSTAEARENARAALNDLLAHRVVRRRNRI